MRHGNSLARFIAFPAKNADKEKRFDEIIMSTVKPPLLICIQDSGLRRSLSFFKMQCDDDDGDDDDDDGGGDDDDDDDGDDGDDDDGGDDDGDDDDDGTDDQLDGSYRDGQIADLLEALKSALLIYLIVIACFAVTFNCHSLLY